MSASAKLYERLEKANIWKSVSLKRKEFLKIKGSIDTNLYYVVKGSLHLFIQGNEEENTIRFGYKNSFISALDSFITEKPSDLCIQAIKSTEVRAVSKSAYLDFIKSEAENMPLWLELLEQLIFQQFERELDILISSPKERYKRVFERSPQLFQEIPQKYIASYLRMAPETLSRLQKS